MTPTHSPLPWKLRIKTDLRGEAFNLVHIEDANQVEVLPTFPSIFEKEKVDAALIVRSVNALPLFVAASEAAVKYDEAIKSCANDPDKMSSYCSAEGDDLDAFYIDWIEKSKAALAAAKGGQV